MQVIYIYIYERTDLSGTRQAAIWSETHVSGRIGISSLICFANELIRKGHQNLFILLFQLSSLRLQDAHTQPILLWAAEHQKCALTPGSITGASRKPHGNGGMQQSSWIAQIERSSPLKQIFECSFYIAFYNVSGRIGIYSLEFTWKMQPRNHPKFFEMLWILWTVCHGHLVLFSVTG